MASAQWILAACLLLSIVVAGNAYKIAYTTDGITCIDGKSIEALVNLGSLTEEKKQVAIKGCKLACER